MQIPLHFKESNLDLYKVITLPVPVNQTTKHTTQLLDGSEYFILSKNKMYYNVPPKTYINRCIIEEHYFQCPFKILLKSVEHNSCILSIFQNHKDDVKELCNFRYVPNVIFPNIIPLSHSTVLVHEIEYLMLSCNESRTRIPGCKLCIIQTKCGCSLSTKEMYIMPSIKKM